MALPRILSLTLASSLLVFALLAGGCQSEASSKPDNEKTGVELYEAYCAQCHGKDGRGTFLNLGPSYEGIRQHWDEAKLLEYIADPAAFAAKDERLGERAMTAIPDTVPVPAREKLVEYALTLMN